MDAGPTLDLALLDVDQVAAYHRDGFASGGRLLTDRQADDLLDVVQDLVASRDTDGDVVCDLGVDGRPLWHVKNIFALRPAFAEVLRHPALAETLHQVTGARRWRLWQDGIFHKPARVGSSHAWHQDVVYLPLHQPVRGTAIWIALTDVLDADAGAMTMVPGSHRWGDASPVVERLGEPDAGTLPPRHQGEPVRSEPCPVAKGHVHLHDGLTWHGSLPNDGGRPRCGLLLFFVEHDARLDPGHPHAHKYAEAMAATFDPALHPVVELDR